MASEQVIIAIIATIIGVYLTFILSYRLIWVKPNIKASFPADSDTICAVKGEIIEVLLTVENIGISTVKEYFALELKG